MLPVVAHWGIVAKSRAAMNSDSNPVSALSLLHDAMEAAAKVEKGVKLQEACLPARHRIKALLEKLARYPDVLGALARASNGSMKQTHLQAVLDFVEAAPAAGRLFVTEQLRKEDNVAWKECASEWKRRKERLTGTTGLLSQHHHRVQLAVRLAQSDEDGPALKKPPYMAEFLAEVMRVELESCYGKRNQCDPYLLSKYLKALRLVHISIMQEFSWECAK